MAGGKGTRISSVVSNVPKPMIPIIDKPLLEYQIESLKKSGILDIIIIIGYMGEVIKNYFGFGEKWNVNITYVVENKPLGTAGALYYLKDIIKEDFFLVFGDLILDIDWVRFMNFHKKYQGCITLFGHPNSHPYDSDVVITGKDNKVEKIDSKKNIRNYYYHNFTNAGLYCVSPKIFENIHFIKKSDFEKDIILKYITSKEVYAYKSTEYVKDIGTPDRYFSVINDIKKGIVSSKNLKNKQKCIFLDRDGTLNVLKGFINNSNDLELIPGVSEAIKLLNLSEYLAIIITNQPVISRGECTFEELEKIHMKLETELGNNGAFLDGIYFCPHHPDKGYKGEIHELKFDCGCRKPKTGMIIKAAKEYNIDLEASWYIGDTTTDIQTGINAGLHTMLVMTGEAGQDAKYNVQAEYFANDLVTAVKRILNIC